MKADDPIDDKPLDVLFHVLVTDTEHECKQCKEPTACFVMELEGYYCTDCTLVLAAVEVIKDEHKRVQKTIQRHLFD